MNPENLPTKRNLLDAKRSLQLARHGHDLLDKKHKVLARELAAAKKSVTDLREILAKAISVGNNLLPTEIFSIKKISAKMPIITNLQITYRSVMGANIPKIGATETRYTTPPYGLGESTSAIDQALFAWQKVLQLIIQLAEAEIAIHNITVQMKKAQKRAAALENITIPMLTARIKYISAQLEERERDELARVKSVR